MSEAPPEVLYENLDGTGRRFETNQSLLIQAQPHPYPPGPTPQTPDPRPQTPGPRP